MAVTQAFEFCLTWLLLSSSCHGPWGLLEFQPLYLRTRKKRKLSSNRASQSFCKHIWLYLQLIQPEFSHRAIRNYEKCLLLKPPSLCYICHDSLNVVRHKGYQGMPLLGDIECFWWPTLVPGLSNSLAKLSLELHGSLRAFFLTSLLHLR